MLKNMMSCRKKGEQPMTKILFICHGRIDENRVNSFKQGGCCFEVAWFRPNLDQW